MKSSLYPILTKEGWGYCNENKEILILPQFDFAFPFYEGLAGVLKYEQRQGPLLGDLLLGFIDERGNEIIPCKFYYSELVEPRFINGVVCVEPEKYGRKSIIINEKQEILFEHDDYLYILDSYVVYPESNTVKYVTQKPIFYSPFHIRKYPHGELWGVIKNGTILYKPQFDDILYINESVIAVKKEKKWSILTPNNSSLEFIYSTIQQIGGYIFLKAIEPNDDNKRGKQFKFGLLNKNGDWIVPFIYRYSTECDFIPITIYENFIEVCHGMGYHWANDTGEFEGESTPNWFDYYSKDGKCLIKDSHIKYRVSLNFIKSYNSGYYNSKGELMETNDIPFSW